jgi:hypothetical protein
VLVPGADYPATVFSLPPAAPPQVQVRVEPERIAMGQAVQVIIHAIDAATGAPIVGAIKVAVAVFDPTTRRWRHEYRAVGRTNAPFTYTFNLINQSVFDLDLLRWVVERVPPTGRIGEPGYSDIDIPFTWDANPF